MIKFSNLKKKDQGFTIVELLVVIVVIGILAAITVVAYTGVTSRANTTKAQTNAVAIQKVADVYFAEQNVYPAALTDWKSSTQPDGAGGTKEKTTKIPAGIDIDTPDADNGTKTVIIQCVGPTACGSTSAGGRIGYWNFSSNSINYLYFGSASSTATDWTTWT